LQLITVKIMARSLVQSNRHFKQALTRLPLGVTSNFRYWGEDKTIYVDHGKGGRLWDIDGNEYVDYRLGYGPCILGYADERVDEAARQGMEIGGVFALSTELEYKVAERIAKMVPAAELVRFSNSGTEAVMAALRLARAYTGKDSYVMVEGGYHGVWDAVAWYTPMKNWDPSQGDPEVAPMSAGIPALVRELLHMVPLNDANRVAELFKAHGHEIGAFLIEPMMGNCGSITATRQYLHDVNELCQRHDVIMIVDEVKTGFRVARGGIQELMGFKADICTFAKAMGNGYPIAAVAGREDIMRMIGDEVLHGGTFTCHSVAIAAADKTLEILDETPALQTIEDYGLRLQQGLSQILDDQGIAHSFVGHPSMGGLFLSDEPPTTYRDWAKTDYTFYEALAPELHDRGIICEPDSREPLFICEAHDQSCLDVTLDAFEQAIEATIDALGDRTQDATG
jgi:glutamate-1-semialdehyde 2,1-aminomutase